MANYIGTMSGTSIDAIDCVIANIDDHQFQLVASYTHYWPEDVKQRLRQLASAQHESINEYGKLHVICGKIFAQAINTLLEQAGLRAEDIAAIGNHGQTIRHQPDSQPPFSLQIGDANIIAEQSNITTVADFRSRDIAAGGQGAPLVPAFHQYLFRSNQYNRVVCNIGGISNITILPADPQLPVSGFDTGPGNTLLDAWLRKHYQVTYDKDGQYSKRGQIDQILLQRLKKDEYFQRLPPKSTGVEYFNLDWLTPILESCNTSTDDVAATLAAYTAETICDAILLHAPQTAELYLCGGGVYNPSITQHLQLCLPEMHIHSTEKLGLSPDWVEAACFAWLAHQTMHSLAGNLPAVTGASGDRVLGAVYAHNRTG